MMPTYLYKARDNIGKAVRGTMDAATRGELIDKLHKMGFMTTHVSETRPDMKLGSFLEKVRAVNTEDMIMFYVQLSNLINAGISILATLDVLNKQIENRTLRETIGSVSRSVEAGSSLSEAMAQYPRVFPPLFVNMVKAGEVSGKLDVVAARYAEYFEQQTELQQKVRGALFYPAILLCAGIAVTLFLVAFVIPQFAQIFIKVGVDLPGPTRILYVAGTSIKKYWHAGIAGAFLCWLGLNVYAKTAAGRLTFDRLMLKLPLLGPFQRKAAIARFSRTLGTLMGSGVPILESLDITRGVVGNEVLGRTIKNARMSIEKGQTLADPLKISEEFPPDAVQMIAVGEETGNLDGMLNKIADFYSMSLGYSVKKMTTVLEPILLLIMGALVGFIMASMLLPIFDMVKVLRH